MRKEKRELIKEEVSSVLDKLRVLLSLLEDEDAADVKGKTNVHEQAVEDEEVIHDEDTAYFPANMSALQQYYSELERISF